MTGEGDMTWDRIFDNPSDSPEQAKLKRAVKRAEKLLREFASGIENLPALDRAISKAEYLARYVAEAERETAYTLRSRIAAAEEAGRAARQAYRDEEMRRLRQKEREARPVPGSFEHELALMRGRRT